MMHVRGYHEYIGGAQYIGDIMSTSGMFSTSGGGGGGIMMLWGIR